MKKLNILLVYEHKHAAEVIQTALETTGYNVTPMENVEECFQKLGDGAFDAIVLEGADIHWQATDATRPLKSISPNTPAVALLPYDCKHKIPAIDFYCNYSAPDANDVIKKYLETLR